MKFSNNDFFFARSPSSGTTECSFEISQDSNNSSVVENSTKIKQKLPSKSSQISVGNTHKKSSSEGTMGVASGVGNGFGNQELSNQLQFQTKTISHTCDSGVGLEDDDARSSTGSSGISDSWSDEAEDDFIEIKSQTYTATPWTVPRSNVSSRNILDEFFFLFLKLYFFVFVPCVENQKNIVRLR